jgi:hypothetical protein
MKQIVEATPTATQHLPPSASCFISFYSQAKSSISDSLQRTLNSQASQHRFDASMTAAKESKKQDGGLALAHAKVTSAPLASTWKSTHPVTAALTLSDAQYRVAARLNLRLDPLRDMSELSDSCPSCGKLDALANDRWHFLACSKHKGPEGEITARHDTVNNALYLSVLTLGGQAAREPRGMGAEDGRRPDLQVVFHGHHLLTDVVVVHPLAPSLVSKATGGPTAVAVHRAHHKHKKYDALAARHGASFFAFSVETCGGMAPESMELLQRVARAGQQQLPLWPYRQILQHMLGNVAMAIQRGNAMTVLAGYASAVLRAGCHG